MVSVNLECKKSTLYSFVECFGASLCNFTDEIAFRCSISLFGCLRGINQFATFRVRYSTTEYFISTAFLFFFSHERRQWLVWNVKESLRAIQRSSWTSSCAHIDRISNMARWIIQIQGFNVCSNSAKSVNLERKHTTAYIIQKAKAKFTISHPHHILIAYISQVGHVIPRTNCEKFVGIMNILHSHYKWHIIRGKLLQNGLLAFWLLCSFVDAFLLLQLKAPQFIDGVDTKL